MDQNLVLRASEISRSKEWIRIWYLERVKYHVAKNGSELVLRASEISRSKEWIRIWYLERVKYHVAKNGSEFGT